LKKAGALHFPLKQDSDTSVNVVDKWRYLDRIEKAVPAMVFRGDGV
jgi:hypothetical protein